MAGRGLGGLSAVQVGSGWGPTSGEVLVSNGVPTAQGTSGLGAVSPWLPHLVSQLPVNEPRQLFGGHCVEAPVPLCPPAVARGTGGRAARGGEALAPAASVARGLPLWGPPGSLPPVRVRVAARPVPPAGGGREEALEPSCRRACRAAISLMCPARPRSFPARGSSRAPCSRPAAASCSSASLNFWRLRLCRQRKGRPPKPARRPPTSGGPWPIGASSSR